MDWRDRVPACFGEQDLIFASHPTDEERAKKAIVAHCRKAIQPRDIWIVAHIGD